jgi:hypothetical protein
MPLSTIFHLYRGSSVHLINFVLLQLDGNSLCLSVYKGKKRLLKSIPLLFDNFEENHVFHNHDYAILTNDQNLLHI